MLKSLIFRVESDFGFRPEGVAMDFDKIERHVQARSSRLLKTSDSICTPELEVQDPATLQIIYYCNCKEGILGSQNSCYMCAALPLNLLSVKLA